MMHKMWTGVLLIAGAAAQKPGSLKDEVHPSLIVQSCTKAGGCASETKSVVIDSNWRWIHEDGKAVNCYSGNLWNTSICPDPATCAANCVIEGAAEEYESTYGVTASGSSLKLDFVTAGTTSTNVGSRLYLLEDDKTYKLFKLKNKEFTFDVDVSKLPCGLNGALYFVSMDADGGMARFPGNEVGAKYGTGYCDAQCPRDVKFINGEPNIIDWTPSPTDKNSGTGKYGTCCVEMDIWEANSISTAYTAHSCAVKEATRCEGIDCGDLNHRFDGVCDKNGCDMQTYRLGNTSFYGAGSSFTLDTTKPITVVTQFVTADGTDDGELSQIRRLYKQGGRTVATPAISLGGKMHDSITTDFCEAEVAEFADGTNFLQKGGLKAMGDSLTNGMVLVLSLWDDHDVNMLWLDSTYPTNSSAPGAARGTCSTSSGKPTDVEKNAASAAVTYSNIKYGEIGSTTSGSSPSPAPSPAPPAPPSGSCATPKYGQCGGVDGKGQPMSACCPKGWACTRQNQYYSQCQPSADTLEAFVHSQPTHEQLERFLASGHTTFSAAGVVPYQPAASQPAAALAPVRAPAMVEDAASCPGGALPSCMKACPSSPLAAYASCTKVCATRCSKQLFA